MSMVSLAGGVRYIVRAMTSAAEGLPAVLFSCIMVSAMAHAEEWPRLADGRVVVTVEGISLAFPAKGPDLRDIRFNANGEHIELGAVIASRDKAARFFSGHGIRDVTIPNLEERTGAFLGRFDRKGLYGFRFTIGLSDASLANCRAWRKFNDEHRDTMRPASFARDGWAEFTFGKSPRNWHYIRAQDALGLPKHFSSLVCDGFGLCTSTTCVGSQAAFIYRFSRKLHGRETWGAAVGNAGDVYRSLFDASAPSGGEAQ